MKPPSHLAVFRADADPQMGGGHVTRSLTIAEGLARRGWECVFASKPQTLQTTPVLKDSGYRIVSVEGEPAWDAAIIAAAFDRPPSLLVIDHPTYAAAEERAFRATARLRMAIDGLFRAHDTEIWLDPNPEHDIARLQSLGAPNGTILTGAEFIPVNAKIAARRAASLARRVEDGHRLGHVLVGFGAGNPGPVLAKVIEGIAAFDRDLAVTVLAATAVDGATEAAARHALGATILGWQNDVGPLLEQADLVIGAGGTGAWERCCLGVPSLVVTIAENQRAGTEFLAARGAAIDGGNAESLTPGAIAEALRKLDPGALATLSRNAAALVDGRGVERLADALTRIVVAAETA